MKLIDLKFKPSTLIHKLSKHKDKTAFSFSLSDYLDNTHEKYKDLTFSPIEYTGAFRDIEMKNQFVLCCGYDSILKFDPKRPYEICILNPWQYISSSKYGSFFPFFKDLTGLEYRRNNSSDSSLRNEISVLYDGQWLNFGRHDADSREMWLFIDSERPKPLLPKRFTFKGVSNE